MTKQSVKKVTTSKRRREDKTNGQRETSKRKNNQETKFKKKSRITQSYITIIISSYSTSKYRVLDIFDWWVLVVLLKRWVYKKKYFNKKFSNCLPYFYFRSVFLLLSFLNWSGCSSLLSPLSISFSLSDLLLEKHETYQIRLLKWLIRIFVETLPLDAYIFVTVFVVNNVSAILVPTKNFTVVVCTSHGLPSATTFLTNEKIVLDGLWS